MAKITINNFSGGLAPNHWQGRQYTKMAMDNMYASGIVNPKRYIGLLAPGNSSLTNLIGIDQLTSGTRVVRFVPFDDAAVTAGFTTFYFGQAAKIHAVAATTIQSTGDFPHTVNAGSGTHSAHTTEAIKDLAIYERNGAPYLFYAYSDNTDGDLGYRGNLLSSPAFLATEDAFSGATGGAVLDKNFDIVLEAADNGFLYVMNGNLLHKFDGTGASDVVTTSLLNFRIPWQIVDARDGLGYLWIALTRAARGGFGLASASNTLRPNMVYVWNRNTTTLSEQNSIPVEGVSHIFAIFFHNGVPHIFTLGFDGIVQLRRYNGRDFEIVREISGTDGVSGAPANRHAITSFQHGILWQDKRGSWYYYGKAMDGSNDALFQVGGNIGTTGTSGQAGAIIQHDGEELLTSTNDASNERVTRFAPFKANTTADVTEFFTKVYELPKLSRIIRMTVYFPAFIQQSSQNVNLKLYKNMSTSSSTTNTINLSTDNTRTFKNFEIALENVNQIQLGIDWRGQALTSLPLFSRIEIEYVETEKVL